MTTSMHRLQISLQDQQLGYLADRARQDGVSMAEVIRRLLEGAAARESRRPSEGNASIGETRPDYQISPTPVLSEVVLHLPIDLYQRLRWEANRIGKPAPIMAQEWLAERLTAAPPPELDDRARVTEVLRASGMLAELGPELRSRADPTISLEEVQAALDRAGGKPLSEIILEQRGPKV
jgi:hypothetical protein